MIHVCVSCDNDSLFNACFWYPVLHRLTHGEKTPHKFIQTSLTSTTTLMFALQNIICKIMWKDFVGLLSEDLCDVCGGGCVVVFWCYGLSAHENSWTRVSVGIGLHTNTNRRVTCHHDVREYLHMIVCVCVTSEDSYVMVFVSMWTTGISFTFSSWVASSTCTWRKHHHHLIIWIHNHINISFNTYLY